MKKSLFIITFLLIAKIIFGQDCTMYFPAKEGAELEYTNYDAKNKVTGTLVQKIVKKESTANSVILTIESTSYDKKNKAEATHSFDVKCENGVFFMNMKAFLPSNQGKEQQDNMEITATDLDIPSNPTIGQTLSDGNVKMSMKAGMMEMNMTVTIVNRKVEAFENVTTPAGTYECIKITYNIITDMMFKSENKAIQWIAKNVGMVKSETYDKSDKLIATSLLTHLNQ